MNLQVGDVMAWLRVVMVEEVRSGGMLEIFKG